MASQLAAAAGLEGLHDSGPIGHHMHLSVGYAKANAAIVNILQSALDSIPEQDRHRMLADALRASAARPGEAAPAAHASHAIRYRAGAAPGAAGLDAGERAWLEGNPTIRAAYIEWPPFEYAGSDGALRGLAAEYVERFEDFTGADIVAERIDDRTEFVAAITNGSVHASFMVPATDELRRHMGLTEPHTVLEWDMVTLGARNYTTGDLPRLSVGTIRSHDIEEWLDTHHPGIDYASIDGHEFAFEALLSGRIDVLLEAWPVAVLAASDLGIAGLHNSGSIGPRPGPVRGVHKAAPRARVHIRKGAGIDSARRSACHARPCGARRRRPALAVRRAAAAAAAAGEHQWHARPTAPGTGC